MRFTTYTVVLALAAVSDSTPLDCKLIRPTEIDLSAKVPHMLDMIRQTRLPAFDLSAARESQNMTESFGVGLNTLNRLKDQWLNDFDWEVEQATLNKLNHYETNIEGLTIHFVHHKSSKRGAIPLIAFHGWPGSFMELVPLIERLTESSNGEKQATFDIVIPSLIGYGLSSPAPDGWNATDSARVFHTLMTEILGYEKYATHGTDWGCTVAYQMYNAYNESARASHFSIIPFRPPTREQIQEQNITLSEGESFQLQRATDWETSGSSYFYLQTTKPNTIGLALFDNPIGQLTWIGEKFISWSDPRQGTGPSLLTTAYIYAQNPVGWAEEYTMAQTDAPLLFSSFKWNTAFWPREMIAQVGNLVYYNFHDFGGHFQSLDNPDAVADDIRQIANYWQLHQGKLLTSGMSSP